MYGLQGEKAQSTESKSHKRHGKRSTRQGGGGSKPKEEEKEQTAMQRPPTFPKSICKDVISIRT